MPTFIDFIPEGGDTSALGKGGFLDYVPEPEPQPQPVVEQPAKPAEEPIKKPKK